ncbi:unnamed protein product [Acanthoscelides obtectus]|uniref:Uncharacterized protein n=1 Tax=Acanthoscelides obtectus TaxID=200917 RepID=A0A9P0PF19_ACAOB|nr:unnamed protein product [Acanthoscelides obtectus]CAK1655919.1 hypothetical protein AOBTE_LOCUS19438 [Acanthoscelides obtectus]
MNEVSTRTSPTRIRDIQMKKNSVFCYFSESYVIHFPRHLFRNHASEMERETLTVASRKMRELARLLIEVRKIKPAILTLFDALKPVNYDTLVSATENTSKYDKKSQSYQTPTFALNMGTTLKQCCDIALVQALKKSAVLPSVQSADIEADLKTLIQIIEGNWRLDVSGQATDLNIHRWNKVTLVPLTGDLKLLKECLLKKVTSAVYMLPASRHDKRAYIKLVETVYCRLLLLNRRRPGELQRLLFYTYTSAKNNENKQAYEEFSEPG